jgi:hypothetical protein
LDLRGRKSLEAGKKLHNEELHNFHVACGYVTRIGEKRHGYRILIEKPKAQKTAFKNGVYG